MYIYLKSIYTYICLKFTQYLKINAGNSLCDTSLLPTFQCTLQCMGHAQKCMTDTQTFPISKLGGWKHTSMFHKSFKTNRQQTLKHLRQYWCYGNRSVIGHRGGWWTLWYADDIGLPPASRETTQTNKAPKHYAKTWDNTDIMEIGRQLATVQDDGPSELEWVRINLVQHTQPSNITSMIQQQETLMRT